MAGMQLVIKGPMKSAKRSAHRHGITVRSCKVGSRGPKSDTIICEAPCRPGMNRKVVNWYTERDSNKKGRGMPPGALTFHGAFCPTGLGRSRRRRRKARR